MTKRNYGISFGTCWVGKLEIWWIVPSLADWGYRIFHVQTGAASCEEKPGNISQNNMGFIHRVVPCCVCLCARNLESMMDRYGAHIPAVPSRQKENE